MMSNNDKQYCQPIISFDELVNWKPDPELNWPNRVIDKISRTSYKVKAFGLNCHQSKNLISPYPRIINYTAPKTIFCHDMKGGYLEDRFPEGTVGDNGYTFFHWAGIDSFIYFSHCLITIPPLAWLNAAHRNGVNVLGTFITEDISGKNIWDKILSDDDIMLKVIVNLAEICKFYRFDGYLLNVENEITSGEGLARFIKLLKSKITELCGKDTELIWYDAVNYEGKLKWQNKLNNLNKKFFDSCDGIFLNYSWKPEDLGLSAFAAGSRQYDVYAGIDVFGRGCFGGGGFNTEKALKEIHDAGLSVAIFAAGWTHECCPLESDTLWREIYFWHKIWEYLYVHGPVSLPLSTNFSLGKGSKKYINGDIVDEQPWYNLSLQDIQICSPYCINESGGETTVHLNNCLKIECNDAFNGGNSLMILRPIDLNQEKIFYIRLFPCELKCDGVISINMVTKIVDSIKTSVSNSFLSLVLLVEENNGKLRRYIMVPQNATNLLNDLPESEKESILKMSLSDPCMNYIHQKKPCTKFNSDWCDFEFELSLKKETIIEIGVTHFGTQPVLLGGLSIVQREVE